MKNLRLIALSVAALAAVALAALSFFPGTSDAPYALSNIEIAATEEARSAGLSGKEVPEEYGMLFVFEREGLYGFWMKDTLVPLDVVWLSERGEVLGIIHDAAPDSYPLAFYPPSPVRYVLEVRGGTAKEKGWATSTVLSLPLR